VKTLILHFHLGCLGGGVKIEGGVDLSILYGRSVNAGCTRPYSQVVYATV
jgi:hypothetical protein